MSAIRVLFVGFDPAKMDLSEFDDARGVAAKIQTGIDQSIDRLTELGYEAKFCPINENREAEDVVRERLRDHQFDCVVIGAGVRLISKHTILFESLVNAVCDMLPNAKLVFNSTPADAAEAVQRWFPSAS